MDSLDPESTSMPQIDGPAVQQMVAELVGAPAPEEVSAPQTTKKLYGTLEYVKKTEKQFDQREYEKLRTEAMIKQEGYVSYNEQVELAKKSNRKVRVNKWKITGAQPCVMLSRIVPQCWSDQPNAVEVEDNLSNIEHIEWLMMRYPLEIKTPRKWVDSVRELHEVKVMREGIRSLQQIEPKSGFKGKLMDFQKEALDFLVKCSGRGLICDEMGLGKTIESLAYVAHVGDAFPIVIGAPLSTLGNWESEIRKFLEVNPLRETLDFVRSPDELMPCTVVKIRSGKTEKLPLAHIYLINYDLLYKRTDDLLQVNPRMVIFDEVHFLRNLFTDRYDGAKSLAAGDFVKYLVGLTGTPVYNRGADLWPLVDLVAPGLLGRRQDFLNQFCDYRQTGRVNEEMRAALHEILKENVMIRRRKVEVLKDLPDKVRHKQKVKADLEYYKRELKEAIKRRDEELKAAAQQAKTDLQRIANANKGFNATERQIAGMAKVKEVVSYVRELMELEESVVVFVHHHVVGDTITNHLYDFHPARIVSGQSDIQREQNIKDFQEGKTRLMIAGLRSGNVGINLQNASYCVFAEFDWTPATHRQAEDRLHRIGQKKTVFSYYLEGKGTFDEIIAGILVDKKLEMDELLGDADFEDPLNEAKKATQILDFIQKRLEEKNEVSDENEE